MVARWALSAGHALDWRERPLLNGLMQVMFLLEYKLMINVIRVNWFGSLPVLQMNSNDK